MTAAAALAKAKQAAASARLLLDAGDTAGACNRAYYAMFDAARAALLAQGASLGRTHQGVLIAFSECLIKKGPLPRETGRKLKRAEARRYVADYADVAIAADEARQMVDDALVFVGEIDAFLGGQ